MPRIREIKVSPFNQVQDIPDDRALLITDNLSRDLERAVQEDYPIDPSGDTSTSEYFHMLEAGAPITAALMLMGATEVAHIDAVACAHKFNGTMIDTWPNAYKCPDWECWERYHDEHGRQCIACECFNYETKPGEQCGNCLAKLPHKKGDTFDCWDSYLDSDVMADDFYKEATVVGIKTDDKYAPDGAYWIQFTLEGSDEIIELRSDFIDA